MGTHEKLLFLNMVLKRNLKTFMMMMMMIKSRMMVFVLTRPNGFEKRNLIRTYYY